MTKVEVKNLERNPSRAAQKIVLWLPVFLWAAVIFLLSSLPTKPVSEIYIKDFIIKKSAHIVEYGIFAVFLYRALKLSGVEKTRAGIYSIFIALLYGITDEYHQSFTPGRDPKARDVIFDTIGSAAAIYIIWKLLPKAPKRLRNWAKSLQLI